MKNLPILLFSLFCISLSAQSIENNYRSSSNPYYWKNRKPHEGYWQQDVQYKLKASIDDKTDIITGSEELTYWNNSPDELPFVYFHLYQNAFTPGSYTDDLHRNNKFPVKFGKHESQGLGTVISKITINGVDLKTELDNTILKVYLPKPLKTGESITFSIDFKTYFDGGGTIRRRMKMFNAYGDKHYDGVHWYPRISVYDSKFGWDTQQHLTREFYGDYGSYDAELTFPNNYVVDATGVLINQSEVLPDSLRKKLDIRNFRDKPLEQAPSVITKPDGTTKTWKYHAINVHDLAFTADPTYRIGEAEWNGIKCYSFAQEPHASRWQNAAQYTAKVIQTYSENIGLYAYPKMTVADARDGMEYPMLTLDGGLDPDYRDLIAHEVGHNWFYGMVGNNETYRAAMDEGFTQFIESFAYEKIDGKYRLSLEPRSKYVRKFLKPELVRNGEVYNGYMFDAIRGMEATLNTHSDMFDGALRHGGGYRQVYMKTATMLYNLQYVLGDELFFKALNNYFEQWKIAHPYWEDFKSSIIHYTKSDLNWFFDQWFETNKVIDYGIKCVRKGKEKDQYIITFQRKGRMQMPIDFQVIGNDSVKHDFYIPNTVFQKKTNATVLPKWFGWDKIQQEYEATVTIPSGIENVIIDPTNRLADINMLNNSSRCPVVYGFDSRIYNTPDWTKYEVFYRPDVWYNGYDGVKVGFNVNGNYMNYRHIFDASIWFNSGIGQAYLPEGARISKFDVFSFKIDYKTATDKFVKNSSVNLSAKWLDGLKSYVAGFEKKDESQKNRLYVYFKSMIRTEIHDLNYLLLPREWDVDMLNNTLNTGIEHSYTYLKGNGKINLSMRTSAIASDYDYSNIILSSVNKNIFKKINFNTRVYLQYGSGKNGAPESALFASGANPEELMESKYTRSMGIFPPDWAEYSGQTNHFNSGGGLNLRGYSGYILPEENADGSFTATYKGNTGAAVNTELEFDKLLKLKPFLKNTFKLNTYLFADAGIINRNTWYEELHFGNLRVDAGAGAALTIQRWGPLQMISPLTIRFDVPFFLNRPPADEEFFQFRWLLGVSRAF
jgi:hypothetical protein